MSELEYCNPACDPECGGRPDSDCFKRCGRFANIAVKVIDDKQSVDKHTDKELLILAARASGVVGEYHEMGDGMRIETNPGHDWWNPLTDDGDALRLAVKLNMEVKFCSGMYAYAEANDCYLEDQDIDNPYAATRRAIVRAAAAIGEKL